MCSCVYWLDEHGGRFDEHGSTRSGDADRGCRPVSYRGAGTGNLSAGGGGGCLFAADVGREIGRAAAKQARTHDSLGHDPWLSETSRPKAAKASRPESRASRQSASGAGADRPAAGAPLAPLPPLRRPAAAMHRYAYTLYRGHPARDPAGGDRARDPSRLVSALQEASRAHGIRCPAGSDAGQPHPGPLVVAALRPGQHAFADRRGLQLPLPTEAQRRRSGADVVSAPGGALPVVSATPGRGTGLGGLARRRDLVACGRQDALVVVFRQRRFDVLYFYSVTFLERSLDVLPATFCDASLWPCGCGPGGSRSGRWPLSRTTAGERGPTESR